MNESDLKRALRTAAAGIAAAPRAEELPARAADEDLLDVAWAPADSPFGPLTVAATPRGLLRVSYPHHPVEAVLSEVSTRVSPRVLEAPERLDPIRRELDEYFSGRRRDFDLAIDMSLTRGFTRQVLQVTAGIGYGRVLTYAEVARDAGSPRAVRAAGNALGANPIPIVVPCHRVLRTGGGIGGYGGGPEIKRHLLRLEGVIPG